MKRIIFVLVVALSKAAPTDLSLLGPDATLNLDKQKFHSSGRCNSESIRGSPDASQNRCYSLRLVSGYLPVSL